MSQKPYNPTNGKKDIYSIDLESLINLINIAYDLKKAFEQDNEINAKQHKIDVSLMMILFEYMVANLDKNNLDLKLLKFLEKFLGIDLKEKKKERERDEEERDEDLEREQEKEEELSLSKQERERRYRLAMYEIYKVLNPHQLAGETALENFVNNVRTRGVHEALKYEGAEYFKQFDKKDLENLESHRFGFAQALKDNGSIGGGRGL